MPLIGALLLHAVAERILRKYLIQRGATDVRIVGSLGNGAEETGVDITYRLGGRQRTSKLKADAYFGEDGSKIEDRELVFYRPKTDFYAFETVSSQPERVPGWMFSSDADELMYYRVAIGQTEQEVRTLLGESDEVFFSELRVERDQLRVLPMNETREWFQRVYEEYAPRPVAIGERSAWFRLIPQAELDRAVPGVTVIDAVFEAVRA